MTTIISIIFGLFSMIAYGVSNVLLRPLSEKLGSVQILFLRGVTIVLVLAVASLIDFQYFTNWQQIIITVILGVLGYLPALAFTEAIKKAPIGIVAPVAGISPLITILLSFFLLKAALSPVQWIAISVVVISSIAITFNFNNFKKRGLVKISSGVMLAFAAAFGWGIFYFLLIIMTKNIGALFAAFLVELGVFIAAATHLLVIKKKINIKDSLQPAVIFNGILICIGTVAFTIGVRYFNIGIVTALSNSTALVASLLGVHLFKEHLTAKVRIAALIIIASIAVLSIL